MWVVFIKLQLSKWKSAQNLWCKVTHRISYCKHFLSAAYSNSINKHWIIVCEIRRKKKWWFIIWITLLRRLCSQPLSLSLLTVCLYYTQTVSYFFKHSVSLLWFECSIFAFSFRSQWNWLVSIFHFESLYNSLDWFFHEFRINSHRNHIHSVVVGFTVRRFAVPWIQH